jgi:hypothetical protein
MVLMETDGTFIDEGLTLDPLDTSDTVVARYDP